MKKMTTNVDDALSKAGAAVVRDVNASQVAMKAGTGRVLRQYRGTAAATGERQSDGQRGRLVEEDFADQSQHGEHR